MTEVKNCLYCNREIQMAAKKCKHCGSWQDETDNHQLQQEQQEISQPKRQNEANSKSSYKNKLMIGIAIGVVFSFLLAGIYYIAKPQQERLYLMGIMEPNSDNSYYVGIGTYDFKDMLNLETEGDIWWNGDSHIVVHKLGEHSNQLKSILKSSQIKEGRISNNNRIRNAYPSSIYKTVVYFDGFNFDEGEFFLFYGKVDIETLQYDVFDKGVIYGMIEYGSYKDCYLVERGDLLYIYYQSPVGESAEPVVAFDPKQYFGNAKFWEPHVKKEIIVWLNNQ